MNEERTGKCFHCGIYMYLFSNIVNQVGGVMGRVLVSSAVDHGFEPRGWVKPKSMKLVFTPSLDLLLQFEGVREKTGWL